MTNTNSAATETVTIKPFKSERAAKMAMTKAEKAYTDACVAAGGAYREAMERDDIASPIEYAAQKRAEQETARVYAQAVYDQAKAQGFWVRSYHFSDCNPTRDLIAANMD